MGRIDEAYRTCHGWAVDWNDDKQTSSLGQMHAAAVLAMAILGVAACDSSPEPTDAGCVNCTADGGTSQMVDASRPDASSTDAGSGEDGGQAVQDAGSDDELDAQPPSSDAAEGSPCTSNRQCASTQRCECDETEGCFCATGPRGTGVSGDTCANGNDCASSLCVEGPEGAFYCSDECVGEGDCEAPLPRCLDIAFVGRFCSREPPEHP